MKILMLVIILKRIISDSEFQYQHRRGDWQLHLLLKTLDSTLACRGTTHVKLMIQRIANCNCKFRTGMATKRKNYRLQL